MTAKDDNDLPLAAKALAVFLVAVGFTAWIDHSRNFHRPTAANGGSFEECIRWSQERNESTDPCWD